MNQHINSFRHLLRNHYLTSSITLTLSKKQTNQSNGTTSFTFQKNRRSHFFKTNDKIIYHMTTYNAYIGTVLRYNPSEHDPNQRLKIQLDASVIQSPFFCNPLSCEPLETHTIIDNRPYLYIQTDSPHYELYSLMDTHILVKPILKKGLNVLYEQNKSFSSSTTVHITHTISIPTRGFLYLTNQGKALFHYHLNGELKETHIISVDSPTYNALLTITELDPEE